MKKFLALTAIFGLLILGVNNSLLAQTPEGEDTTAIELTDSVAADTIVANDETEVVDAATVDESGKLHPQIKEKYIEGGAMFMSFVLISLILGLALAIERIIYLNFADVNTKKFLEDVEAALESGGIESAKEVCANTRGPVASIFYQGLLRSDEGIEIVEKSVISYGSVQMGLLEKGLTWISLFISIAPMLGFMGTVIGMISAFDSIQAAGNVDAGLVAGGIKVALITTVSGLIVAMILQVFYNYLVSKIDTIVTKMEDASISLIDLLTTYENK
ncbi:MAG: MotA/TolQ/ExbB proton channel family protein [Bacteroidota bacterium]|nr:MotA/TolQ/ExbB proton channel family protein [Bacteroidota bacterium]